MNFSVAIINLVKQLKARHETVIFNQIGRSGTSIGANIYEANYAQGKKDFISKLERERCNKAQRSLLHMQLNQPTFFKVRGNINSKSSSPSPASMVRVLPLRV